MHTSSESFRWINLVSDLKCSLSLLFFTHPPECQSYTSCQPGNTPHVKESKRFLFHSCIITNSTKRMTSMTIVSRTRRQKLIFLLRYTIPLKISSKRGLFCPGPPSLRTFERSSSSSFLPGPSFNQKNTTPSRPLKNFS